MEKLRILISAYDFYPKEPSGSYSIAGLMAWKIVEQLSQEYDLSVITHSGNRELVMEALEQGQLPRVSISFVELPHVWPGFRKTESGQSLLYHLWQRKALRFARWLHQEKPFDASHQLTPRYDWAPSFIGAYMPIPFIWGPLGGGEESLSFVQNCGRKSRVWKKCSERAEAILVCDRETRELFPQKMWKKIQFFPWGGIAQAEFPVMKRRAQDQTPYCVFTAGLEAQEQNWRYVLKAFQYFSNTHPDSQLQIVCHNGAGADVAERVTELGLQDRVTQLDWMPRHELRKMLTTGDLFVYLGRDEEGESLLVDAMSSGLPIVGRDAGGPGITIQDGWGVKIAESEPHRISGEVAQVLEQLYKERSFRRKLSRAARKSVKDYYLWEQLGRRLRDLYAEHFLQEENIHFASQGEGRFFY
jgi:glycosyltransferase involved in cell wall biosynthesis